MAIDSINLLDTVAFTLIKLCQKINNTGLRVELVQLPMLNLKPSQMKWYNFESNDCNVSSIAKFAVYNKGRPVIIL